MPAEPLWQVTGQQETFDLGPNGTFVAGVRVSFRTASGATGSVFVPAEAYSADEVRRRVAEQAAVMEEVARMQG